MPQAKREDSFAPRRVTLKAHILVFLLILILAFSVYANSLKGELFWDDIGLIKENYLIKNWDNLPQLFLLPLSPTFHYCFRPLLNLSFMIDYSIWQLNPLGYHITAVALHILNAYLVYLLFYLLSRDFKLAFASGLIFSVHTIFSEPVNYLSSRADLLIGLFCLSSFIFYVRYRIAASPKKIYLIISLVLFVLGLLSKEMAIVLILMLVLYELILASRKEIIQRRLLFISPFLAVLFIFALIRASVLKANVPVFVERFAISELSLWQRFFTSLMAIPTYIRLLFVPVGLHKEWLLQPIETILNFNVIYALILITAVLFLARFVYRYSKLATFGMLWFLVLLLPVLNIFPLNSFLSEAWLYLPSVGFFLCIFALMSRFMPQKSRFDKVILIIALIFMVSFYSFLTVRRNHVWANERHKFFTEISELNPYSSRAYTNLGLIYVQQNKLNEAIEEFVKALEIEPNNPGLHRNMGNVYMRLNNFDLAVKAYKKALSINPKDAETLGNLGNLYSDRNELDVAADYIKQAIEINPNSANFHNSLGTIYFKMNRLNDAAVEYQKAIAISPDDAKAYTNLGIAYYHQGLLDKSIDNFDVAVSLDPNYVDVYYNLGVIYFSLGQYEKSRLNLEKTLMLTTEQNRTKFVQNARSLLSQIPLNK